MLLGLKTFTSAFQKNVFISARSVLGKITIPHYNAVWKNEGIFEKIFANIYRFFK